MGDCNAAWKKLCNAFYNRLKNKEITNENSTTSRELKFDKFDSLVRAFIYIKGYNRKDLLIITLIHPMKPHSDLIIFLLLKSRINGGLNSGGGIVGVVGSFPKKPIKEGEWNKGSGWKKFCNHQ